MKLATSLTAALLLVAYLLSCTKNEYTTNYALNQPEISITMPVPGDTLRGLVAISTQASGNAEISRVDFYLDGVLPEPQAADSTAPYQYLWNTSATTDGNHLVFARAWTSGGNYGDAVPMLVLVDNVNENAPRNLRVPSQYPTIQQGVNAAKDGDTVLVEPGIYHEDFNFRGKGIWVKSEMGPAQTVWEGTNQNIFVYFNSGEEENTVLCGFKIRNAYNGILLDANCSPTIINCVFNNLIYTGIIGGPSNAIIQNNTVNNCQFGMQVGGICIVNNNIITSSRIIGLWNSQVNPQYAPIGDYNDVWNSAISNYSGNWNAGTHDISVDPIFHDTIDFRLQPESPCVDAGDFLILDSDGTRSDMGAWGGPHAY